MQQLSCLRKPGCRAVPLSSRLLTCHFLGRRLAADTTRRTFVASATKTPEAPSAAHRLLGVTPRASEKQIKAAFRRKALQCHPDVVGPDRKEAAEEEFLELEAAYSELLGRGPTTARTTSAGRPPRPDSMGRRARRVRRQQSAPLPPRFGAFLCLPFGFLVYSCTFGNLGTFGQKDHDDLWAFGGWSCPTCATVNEPGAPRCRRCRGPALGQQYG